MYKRFLLGTVLGATSMYYLDPARGDRRRALVRDKMIRVSNQAKAEMLRSRKDIEHRVKGALAETWARLRQRGVGDEVLEARVRSEMGRAVSHPSAIEVQANQGCIRLRGLILASEVNACIQAVSHVIGVQKVDNQLEIHQTAGNISSLQGQRKRKQNAGFPDIFLRSPGYRLMALSCLGALASVSLARAMQAKNRIPSVPERDFLREAA